MRGIGADDKSLWADLSIVLICDHLQMPPCTGTIYGPITADTKPDTREARQLWKAVKNVIFLEEPMRCSDDAIFSLLKRRMRNGACTEVELDLLNGRVIDKLPQQEVKNFLDAPYLSHRWKELNAVNEHRIKEFAKRTGRQLIVYEVEVRVAKAIVPKNSWLRTMMQVEASSHFSQEQCRNVAQKFYYVEGADYLLLQKVQGDCCGAYNGNLGTAVGIVLDPGEPLMRDPVWTLKYPPKAVLLHFKKHEMNTKLPYLQDKKFPIGTIPIIPRPITFKKDLRKINKSWFSLYENSTQQIDREVKITMLGFQMCFNRARTDYKAQGLTLSHVIVNLLRPPL